MITFDSQGEIMTIQSKIMRELGNKFQVIGVSIEQNIKENRITKNVKLSLPCRNSIAL